MIEFGGIDIVLDRKLGDERTRDGVAAALSVETARVVVIHDMAQYPERQSADVVCVVTQTSGDFAEVVSIQCAPMKLPFARILDVVARLSSALQVRILAPDEGPNPYFMWLVEPEHSPIQVALDEAALEDERYEIRANQGQR